MQYGTVEKERSSLPKEMPTFPVSSAGVSTETLSLSRNGVARPELHVFMTYKPSCKDRTNVVCTGMLIVRLEALATTVMC